MNDQELDQMLNEWKTAIAPASLRERVRDGYRRTVARPVRNWWISSFMPRAGAIAAAGLFVVVLTKGAAAVLWAPAEAANAAFTIETESSEYFEDGSASVSVYSAAYDKNGRQIPLSRSVPNDQLGTLGMRAMDWIVSLHNALAGRVHGEPFRTDKLAALQAAGCAVDPVVGRETMLGHSTVEVRNTFETLRRTAWLAPDLGCFALKYMAEVKQPDGSFRLVRQERALNVIVKPAGRAE